jgi:hypothetical protein
VEIGSDFIHILSKKEKYPERESFWFRTAVLKMHSEVQPEASVSCQVK